MQRPADQQNNFFIPSFFTRQIAGTKPKKSINGVIRVINVAVDLLLCSINNENKFIKTF